MGKNNFLFPQQSHLEIIKDCLSKMNGAASFKESVQQDGSWEAEIHLCSSNIFEKASVARVDLCNGSVEEVPTDITLLQAFAWPANPFLPGLIIMASASSTEGADPIITFFTDLIMQNGTIRQADKEAFSARLAAACKLHGQDIAEYQALMAGRGMLGECAAECGMLYFFEQSDAAMLSDIIEAPLKAYAEIISAAAAAPAAENFARMKNNRKKIIDWMLTQDYGVKVSRQNNIPMEAIEAYGFPPMSS
jgi:hypothetical protein